MNTEILSSDKVSKFNIPVTSPGNSQEPSAPTNEHIMKVALGFWASKTLLTAAELGLFSELGRGPLDAETLRQRLGLHQRSAVDFFDALVAMRFLERREGLYSNTPETDMFLVNNKPSYIGDGLKMLSRRLYRDWDALPQALRTGAPQNENKNGASPFETLYSTPDKLEEFLRCMTSLSLTPAQAIARKFPWKDYSTFADVGAAQVAVPVQLALAHPHLEGFGYDLPAVRPVFEKYVLQSGVADRVSFKAGDFFKDPLPAAEVIVMGHILHDWNMEQKKLLIKKAYNALPKGGAFVIYEALIDDNRSENAVGLLMSLNMLVETPGGFDYTGADCQKWLRQAGFRETRVEHLVGPDSMVIGIK
jgi:hypothetical protein